MSTLITLLANTANSLDLGIGHYENVTTKSCGMRSFESMSPLQPHPTCFKWHKTISEQTSEKLYMSGISGGRYVKRGEFPYTVLIMAGTYTLKTLKFYIGITTYPNENTTYYVADFSHAHEKYDIDNYHTFYDIALIKLETKIKLNDHLTANSICLPESGFKIDKPELAVFTGWGYISDEEMNKEALKVTLVKLNQNYSSGGIIVTKDVSLGIICKGDSGGPLVQYVYGRAVLIGICVFTGPQEEGKGCGPINRVEFTSISYHIDWIREWIGEDYDYD